MKIGLMIATEGELEAFLKSGEGIRKETRAGKKVYITGKGRCNLTNACGREEFFEHIRTNPRFLYSSFSRFSRRSRLRRRD